MDPSIDVGTSPIWLGVGGVILLILLVIIVAAARGGGVTVIKE